MNILIVDDNAMNAKILEFNLNKKGYDTIVVHSGMEALDCLASTPEIQLVISDIMMPEMDGLELLDKIKQRSEWQNIPVIMCTALSDLETVRKAVKAGCRNYIVKPIKAVQLIQKVRQTLGHEKTTLKDKDRVISELGVNRDVYDDIRKGFAVLVDNTIKTLEQLPEGQIFTESQIDLVKLSESASLIGAERVFGVLDRLLYQKIEASDHSLLLRELKVLQQTLKQGVATTAPVVDA